MKIHISEYPVFMKLGYYSRERLPGQEILVSLEADIGDSLNFAEKEELSASVDYGQLIRLTEETLRDKEIKLVETVVSLLGRRVIEQFPRIVGVNVRVEKPVLPDGMGKGAKVSVSHYFSRDGMNPC